VREAMAKAPRKSASRDREIPAGKRTPLRAEPLKFGRREQNKKDKLERIIAAARQSFVDNGFDATRIRDIARQAGVATGTIFKYAEDKRDLVFLAANDEFEALTARAFAALPVDARFLDQLEDLFRNYYLFYCRNKRLARILLREIFFFNVGRQAPRTIQNVQSTIDRLAAVVRAAQRRGEVRSSEDPNQIARLLYSIYQIEVRRWVDHEPLSVEKGIATLRQILALALRGSEA
jgi:AcrR family transcriptional regulator